MFTYHEPQREASRVGRTPVLVAIARALPERFANLPLLLGAASELLSPAEAAAQYP